MPNSLGANSAGSGASYSLSAPSVPEAKPAARFSPVRKFLSGFLSDSLSAIRKLADYAKHPVLILKDFREIKSEVSGKCYASAAGLLIFSTVVSEIAACAGRYAGYLGESFGAYGVAVGILLGDHAASFVAGQVAWFLTTAKALGATTFRDKLSAFAKIEPIVVSTWARGFALSAPLDVIQLFSFVEMYSSMGAGAIASAANGVFGMASALGIMFSLAINMDLIAKIAKKLSLPERKMVTLPISSQPLQQKEAPPFRSEGREE
ncbi:MAG: hypothetical protein WCY41_01475 [Candidatus Micrarchaeia archaeon]